MNIPFVLARLEKFEGRVPHMYRCTGGEVTIGIGHAIQTAEDALELAWAVDGRGTQAEQIRADYARVAGAQKGQAAASYASLSRCRLSDAAIEALAAADVAKFAEGVARVLPNFNRYPECVQAALFDMTFNLGLGGIQKFHHLIAACDAGDWEAAAQQSHRHGIGDGRNEETAALFRQALAKER
jgi:GH24 family phage-related lysozyme (muramidase)